MLRLRFDGGLVIAATVPEAILVFVVLCLLIFVLIASEGIS